MAIIGQEEASLAIILNLINPNIGGILINGTKGTGKSTIVYGIPQIAPDIEINQNCLYNCDPNSPESYCSYCNQKSIEKEIRPIQIINIPLNISEENLFGKIDIENLLKNGEKTFIPGLLAKAHRQILYIDEVNLIPDHITDSLLDVAASGLNKVEREGFSIIHKSDFLLIGTMNKEEGELRPQILDRFPLSITVETVVDHQERKEIVRRNIFFENNPAEFYKLFEDVQNRMKFTIIQAQKHYPKTFISDHDINLVLEFLIQQKVDGHRSELVIFKTARAYAALEFKEKVEIKHLRTAMKLTLLHRTREGGLKKPLTFEDIELWLNQQKTNDNQTDFKLDIHPENISLFKGGYVSPAKK